MRVLYREHMLIDDVRKYILSLYESPQKQAHIILTQAQYDALRKELSHEEIVSRFDEMAAGYGLTTPTIISII